MNVYKKDSAVAHTHHLVTVSPYPLMGALNALMLALGLTLWFHLFEIGIYTMIFGFLSLVYTIVLWFRDIIREGTYEGVHTFGVQEGLLLGMILFITSEVMFFFSFFWAYFSAALAPTLEIGGVFPPIGIQVFNANEVPLLNTLILLLSGASVTWAHNGIIARLRKPVIISLIYTVTLGLLFTGLQALEYLEANFTLSDGIYGSAFFLLTGFHGLHVLIGTTLLFVCLIRQLKYHFTSEHHFGFNFAAAYWHFVDVVWLFLFVFVYIWGGNL